MTNLLKTTTNPIISVLVPFIFHKPLTFTTRIANATFEVNGVKKDIDFNELIDVSKVKGRS